MTDVELTASRLADMKDTARTFGGLSIGLSTSLALIAAAKERDELRAALASDMPEIEEAERRGMIAGRDVINILIDALTGLECAYREGEAVLYAEMEARAALKAGRDFSRLAAANARIAELEAKKALREVLGDSLYKAGARFGWNCAVEGAEDRFQQAML